MSLVKLKNKKTGTTYVYESESYWDKEKKQPRNKRKLIGKIDEETGEIIPTKTHAKSNDAGEPEVPDRESDEKIIAEQKEQISRLESEIKKLKSERHSLSKKLLQLAREFDI